MKNRNKNKKERETEEREYYIDNSNSGKAYLIRRRDARNNKKVEILGSYGEEYEDDCLLGCCSV